MSWCLVLNVLPTWQQAGRPGRSPGQGLSSCVYVSSSSARSSRPCLNTNNNNKVKGKNTIYHLSLMWLVFLQQTLIFQDFRAIEISPRHAPTCTCMQAHEIPAFSNVQWQTRGCWKIWTTWKYTSKTSHIMKLPKFVLFQGGSRPPCLRSSTTSSGVEDGQLSCCPEVTIQTSLMRWHASLYPHMD